LDVALNRPHDALPHLERAHRFSPGEGEIASSYAHALLRSGQLQKAEQMLLIAVKSPEEAATVLKAWQYANGNRVEGNSGR
jgi:predicted Zn-dependent protease